MKFDPEYLQSTAVARDRILSSWGASEIVPAGAGVVEREAQYVRIGGAAFRAALTGQMMRASSATLWFCSGIAKLPPKTIFVSDLADSRIELLKAIPVSVEFDDGVWTVFSHDLDEMGNASDEYAAIDDFRGNVTETYLLLKAERDRLGPLQQRHWDYLSRIVREL